MDIPKENIHPSVTDVDRDARLVRDELLALSACLDALRDEVRALAARLDVIERRQQPQAGADAPAPCDPSTLIV